MPPGCLVCAVSTSVSDTVLVRQPSSRLAEGVLIAASAPRTAELLDNLGFIPVVVDISEFEKLEGCVTCLSVLLPGR